MLKYNSSNQAYKLIKTFSLLDNGEVRQYSRVKFIKTGNIQVVESNLEKLGRFEDESLIKELDKEDEPNSFVVKTLDEIITAISPNGDEFDIPSGEIEDFSINNKLDYDAVKLVINGQQKTHRRWSFRKKEQH